MKRKAIDFTPPTTKKSMNNIDQIASVMTQFNIMASQMTTKFSEISDDSNVSPALLTILQSQNQMICLLGQLLGLALQQNNKQQQQFDPDKTAEEKERQRSLVLLRLPEQKTTTDPFERAQEDQKQVHSVLHLLGVGSVPVTSYRMGKAPVPTENGGRPRPVKIVLSASTFQHQYLGAWKRLRENIRTGPWSRLLLRPSLTREQLRLEYEARMKKRAQMQMNTSENTRRPSNSGPFAATISLLQKKRTSLTRFADYPSNIQNQDKNYSSKIIFHKTDL